MHQLDSCSMSGEHRILMIKLFYSPILLFSVQGRFAGNDQECNRKTKKKKLAKERCLPPKQHEVARSYFPLWSELRGTFCLPPGGPQFFFWKDTYKTTEIHRTGKKIIVGIILLVFPNAKCGLLLVNSCQFSGFLSTPCQTVSIHESPTGSTRSENRSLQQNVQPPSCHGRV